MAINKNDYLDVDGNYDLKKALVDELIDGLDSRSRHYNLDYSGDRAGLINSLIDLFNASEIGVHGYSGAWAGNYYIGGNIYKIANNIGMITMTAATEDASSKIYNSGVGWNEVISNTTTTTTTINTLQNGWEGYLTLSRYGDLVSIKGELSKTGTIAQGTVVAAIPSDFQSSVAIPIAVVKTNMSPYDSSFLFWMRGTNIEIRTSATIPANQSGVALRINQIYSV